MNIEDHDTDKTFRNLFFVDSLSSSFSYLEFSKKIYNAKEIETAERDKDILS